VCLRPRLATPALSSRSRGTPRLAKLAYLAHNGGMNADLTELSVSQARDHFSDAVNRAAFGGQITYVTRGRSHQRAAAIVPAELVEQYEAMIDLEDGRIAQERLANLDAGRTAALPSDEAARALGL
jgi:antitoxin (DNA-binding transcriptional repressor) of toxin-antitoxin stability system